MIGLGIIGRIWAGHLEDDGVLRASWNRTPKPDAPRWVDSAAEVVEASEVVFIVVADPPAVASVLDQIEPALGARHLVVQSSTIDPASSVAFGRRVQGRGARYLEAPFTGSKPAAEQRQTVFYLGGEEAVLAEAEPVLERISTARLKIGAGPQASTLKLAMNMQISAIAQVLCEAIHLTRAAGIDDDTFFACLNKNVAASGLSALKDPKLRAGDYSPQFSIKHMLKDLRLALGSGRADDLALTAAVERAFQRAHDNGFGEEDFIALYKNLS